MGSSGFATRVRGLALVPVLVAFARCAGAQLGCLETDRLRLVYVRPLHSYVAGHVARCFENSLGFQRRLFDYTPREKTTIILSDFTDYGNAGAGAVPRNGVAVSIAPMSLAYDTYPSNERMNTLMNHELVHVANFDRPSGFDLFFRSLFRGKVKETSDHPETILYAYLTAPRTAGPRWYHEGIAVFVETWMAGGLGRAWGPYDEMVFRSMVRDGTPFYSPLGLVSEGTKVDFQLELNSYLYGTRFMSYLAYRYSPEDLVAWVTRADGTRGYFAREFPQVFGRSLDDAWRQWIDFERGFQQANLDSIRQYPTTPYEDISPRALGSVSREYYDLPAGRIYAGLNYPGHVAHVAAISIADGSIRHLKDVKGPTMYTVTSLAFDPDGGKLFYTTDNSAWRDLVSLDPATGRTETLLKDARIGELVFDRADRSLWGVRHYNGYATLVRVPHPYEQWNQVHTWHYGEIMVDLDVSPDGRLLSATMVEASGHTEVRVFEVDRLLEGETAPVARFDFGKAIPSNFVFSPDGRYLYGTSYLTGVSNVFRYDLQARATQALTNCETGFFRPIPVTNDSLIVLRYTGEGFVPAWITVEPLEDVAAITFLGAETVKRHPELNEWTVGSPADIPLPELTTYDGDYRALRSVELESVYPMVEGYKEYPAYGLRADLSDPISLHQFGLSASYTPNTRLPANERLHAQVTYHRYDWRAAFEWNDADFYDLFGPTKTSLKGYAARLGYGRTLIYDQPRELDVDANVAFYGGLDRVPDYQNVAASYDQLFTARVRLDYKDLRFSLGAVDYEKGMKAALWIGDNHANGQSYPSTQGELHLGVPTLLPHASIWLRTYAGYNPGRRDEPFANFFFGAFGNNYVDHQEPKRYREWYSFPGASLNEIGGTNYLKAMVDWNLPPWRFSGVGKPSFYASWARTSLFGTVLATNVDSAPDRIEAANLGMQVDVRLSLLSHLDMTAWFGYAWAYSEGLAPRDELMFSLKIL